MQTAGHGRHDVTTEIEEMASEADVTIISR